MKINVKQLHGEDHPIEVTPDAEVIKIKEELQNVFDLPVERQKLMFKGKTLVNTKTLKEYNIEDGSRIHLFKAAEIPFEPTQPNFWNDLNVFLRDFFNETDRKKIIDHMKKDASEFVERLSLDDIERLALRKLEKVEI